MFSKAARTPFLAVCRRRSILQEASFFKSSVILKIPQLLYSKKVIEKSLENNVSAESKLESTAGDESKLEDAKIVEDNKPWYLQVSPSVSSTSFKPVVLPDIPKDLPELLTKLCYLMATKLGLTDLEVLDVRDGDAAGQVSDFMVIATGRSGRHCSSSADLLSQHIKKEYPGARPSYEGTNTELARKIARRVKKLVRKRSGSGTDQLYGDGASVPDSWILFLSDVDRIGVNILTSERREELCLEHLWAKAEDKHKYSSQKKASVNKYEDIFAGIRYFHTLSRVRSCETSFSSTNQLSLEILNKLLKETFTPITSLTDKLMEPLPENVCATFIDIKKRMYNIINEEEFDELYHLFDDLLCQEKVTPSIFFDLFQRTLRQITSDDLIRIAKTFERSIPINEIDPASKRLELVYSFSFFIKMFNEQGGVTDFLESKTQELYLILANILYPSQFNENLQDRLKSTYKFDSLTVLISNISEEVISRAEESPEKLAHSLDSFLEFRNKVFLKAIRHAIMYDFNLVAIKLWENKDFSKAISIHTIQNHDSLDSKQTRKEHFKEFDPRPWQEFLELIEERFLINNVSENFVEYVLTLLAQFRYSNVEPTPGLEAVATRLFNMVDPTGARFSASREAVKVVNRE